MRVCCRAADGSWASRCRMTLNPNGGSSSVDCTAALKRCNQTYSWVLTWVSPILISVLSDIYYGSKSSWVCVCVTGWRALGPFYELHSWQNKQSVASPLVPECNPLHCCDALSWRLNPPLLPSSRTSLPTPMFSRNDVSIWSILKKCIGMVRTHLLSSDWWTFAFVVFWQKRNERRVEWRLKVGYLFVVRNLWLVEHSYCSWSPKGAQAWRVQPCGSSSRVICKWSYGLIFLLMS